MINRITALSTGGLNSRVSWAASAQGGVAYRAAGAFGSANGGAAAGIRRQG